MVLTDLDVPAARRPLDRAALLHSLAAGPWRDVEVHATLASTQDRALADPRPWRAVVAGHQSAGRGRRDRTWSAPPNASVALSAVLPLPAASALWGWVPLLAGLAAADAVAAQTGVTTALKWPNDVLAHGPDGWGKLAGILCQIAPGAAEPAVVVGIGLNLDLAADELPAPGATSLRLCGAGAVDPDALVAAVLDRLAVAGQAWQHEGPALEAARERYRAACDTLGRQVQVLTAGGPRHGTAADVDEAGRLLLRAADGTTTAHAEGDVVHVRPAGAALPATGGQEGGAR